MSQYVFSMLRVSKVVPPQKQIIKDISLSFFPGAKIGLLGLNGSGKSTVLRIMAGVDKEFEGEAIPMSGINIGYLPQDYAATLVADGILCALLPQQATYLVTHYAVTRPTPDPRVNWFLGHLSSLLPV